MKNYKIVMKDYSFPEVFLSFVFFWSSMVSKCLSMTTFKPSVRNTAGILKWKLIGARYFNEGFNIQYGRLNLSLTGEFLSARDKVGHGTHTLSTAGGNFVKNASLYGHGEGVAKGGAPHARVASYKVCWPDALLQIQCSDADLLAAFDAAIHDGVDVLSISLGGQPPFPDYFQDAISIGSFHAVQRGKVVVCSAGNLGPIVKTVGNVAPWLITVAASSIDRQFNSSVHLGNNRTYEGLSLAQFQLPKGKLYPLVSSVRARAHNASETAGQMCFPRALDPRKVKGKIVACLQGVNTRIEKGQTVQLAGGAGMILCNAFDGGDDIIEEDVYTLPATELHINDGAAVLEYIESTASPVASIFSRTELNIKPAPLIPNFSSRGPNSLTPDILKPDIAAPGVDILAAFSEAAAPSELLSDDRRVPFIVLSGTSMACPHIAGVAALLKSAYSDWSPAAIRSAIMTTAGRLDNTKTAIKNGELIPVGPFNYGAGQVNPNKAINPGLVYDLSAEDYNTFLCSLNYNSTQLRAITGKAFNCSSRQSKIYNLNYPSISVSKLNQSIIVRRTVTNVAVGPATYKAEVQSPNGVSVSIKPGELVFSKKGEKKSFSVALKALNSSGGDYVYGSLTWKHPDYVVASPIVVNVT